jgi:polar amino acid transport system substrate-binding protein
MALLLLLPWTSMADSGAIPFRVCYENQEYMPFTRMVASDDDLVIGHYGVLPDLVLLASQNLDLKPKFIAMPWKRCIRMMQLGKVDTIYAAIWQASREIWGVFPMREGEIYEPARLWRVKYSIFTSRTSALQWDGSRFDKVKSGVAAPPGYVPYERLNKLGVLPVQNLLPHEAFPLLVKNRLDGYVIEQSIGHNIAHKLGLSDKLRTLETDFMVVDWYMPVSHQWFRQNPELTVRFWHALGRVRESQGQALYQNYLDK